MFFADNVLDFGDFVGGVKNVAFTYDLTLNAAIPEPSTWAMLLGFVGLAFAGYRRALRTA